VTYVMADETAFRRRSRVCGGVRSGGGRYRETYEEWESDAHCCSRRRRCRHSIICSRHVFLLVVLQYADSVRGCEDQASKVRGRRRRGKKRGSQGFD